MTIYFKAALRGYSKDGINYHTSNTVLIDWNASSVTLSTSDGRPPIKITPASDIVVIDTTSNIAGTFTPETLVAALQAVFPKANSGSGSPGAPGAQGPAGPQGATGATGATGPAGTTTASGIALPTITPVNSVLANGDTLDVAANKLQGQVNAKASNLTPTAIKTAAYTAQPNDLVLTDATAGNVPIALPTAPADKTRVGIKMIGVSGTNTTPYTTGGSDVLNKAGGSTTASLSLLNQSAILQYNSSTGIWSVTSADIPLSQLDLRFAKQSDLSEKGTIITDNFANLTNWTSVGTAFTVSGKLNVPNGANDFSTSYLKNTSYGGTNLRKWTASIGNYVIPTIGAASFGITFGIKSLVANNKSLAFRFCADTTKQGLIEVYFAESAATVIAVSVNPLAITAGDITAIRIQRIKSTFILTWQNLTASGKPSVVFRYEAPMNNSPTITVTPPNYGQFALYANGGATTIDSISVSSNELVGADFAVVGTSIDVAHTVGNPNQTWLSYYENFTGQKVSLFAGGGNSIDNVNAAEIVAHSPKNILLSLATNNLGNGDSTATMLTKLASLISSLTGYTYGTNLFISNVMPRNDFDATAYNTALYGAYANLIDVNTTFRASGGTGIQSAASQDGVHLLPESQVDYASIMTTAMIQRGKATLRNIPLTNNRVPYYENGKLQLGVNYQPPIYAVEINPNDNNNTQLKIARTATSGDGLFLGANTSAAGNFYALSGVAYDAGQWISKASVVFGLRASGTKMYFIGKTNSAAGGNFGAFDETTSAIMGYVVPGNNSTNNSQWMINPVMNVTTTGTANVAISKYFSVTRLAALSAASVSITAFPAATIAGQIIVIQNLNTSTSFTWGAPAAAKWSDGSSVGIFPNSWTGIFISDGTNWVAEKPNKLRGYTVATLPTGTAGDMAYVTDGASVTFGATATGGGATVAKVFYNGTNWIYE